MLWTDPRAADFVPAKLGMKTDSRTKVETHNWFDWLPWLIAASGIVLFWLVTR